MTCLPAATNCASNCASPHTAASILPPTNACSTGAGVFLEVNEWNEKTPVGALLCLIRLVCLFRVFFVFVRMAFFFVSILLLSLSPLRACFCLWQHCCVRYLCFGDVPKTLPKQWRAVCSPKKERDHYHRQNAIMTLAPAPTHGFTVLCISTMPRLHPTKCGE